MTLYSLIVTIINIAIIIIAIFGYIKSKRLRDDLIKREEDTKRKMYEISILKELGDRMGYSLNIQNIIDIITGSLNQFIKYSAVSYMFLEPEKIIFKVHLEKSVSRKFVDDIKSRMSGSLSALLGKDFKDFRIEELLSGVIFNDGSDGTVRSFFNIPLAIAGNVVGVLTIADTGEGLYKEEEMTILYKITQQASSAVSRLQEVVKTEQGKLNSMVFSMTEGVIMTDLDYRILVVNPAAKKAIGLENKSELNIFDFIDKLNGKIDFRGRIEESIKFDKVYISDDFDLNGRFFKVMISPVKNKIENNKEVVLGCVVIFNDITHAKELEKMRQDFTSMIVHELRSPLDTTKKILEEIRLGEIKKQKQAQFLQLMYKNSSDMLELINNLLDVAKIEAGKFVISKQPSDIKDLIKNRVDFFETTAKDAKLKISYKFYGDIPEKIVFDQKTIAQVLNNFISNAIKFSKENGKILVNVLLCKDNEDISKKAEEFKINWFLKDLVINHPSKNDYLLISITDFGLGIAYEEINNLFIKFSQVENVFTKKPGTGLGLAVAKNIVESHGGRVGVGSIEGQGSTFYFTIPINNN